MLSKITSLAVAIASASAVRLTSAPLGSTAERPADLELAQEVQTDDY